MLLLLVLVLTILNHAIYKKEQIKKHGEVLLLELVPRDPRSLMQGDYMSLRYLLEKDIPNTTHQKHGFIVVRPNKNHVARFVRIDDEPPLAGREYRLRFRKGRYGKPHIVPDSFFFQEGHAKRYEDAKYAILKVDESNHPLLIGLADKNRKRIVTR